MKPRLEKETVAILLYFLGFALIYDTLDFAKKFEPKYRLGRQAVITIPPKNSRKQVCKIFSSYEILFSTVLIPS